MSELGFDQLQSILSNPSHKKKIHEIFLYQSYKVFNLCGCSTMYELHENSKRKSLS